MIKVNLQKFICLYSFVFQVPHIQPINKSNLLLKRNCLPMVPIRPTYSNSEAILLAMEFVEYEKMALSLDPFKDAFKRLEKEEWIVLEKVHGANFSCHTDGTGCKFARRRDFLKENEGFYSYKGADFMKGFCDKALHIYKRVQELNCDREIAQVVIYGEICGGE